MHKLNRLEKSDQTEFNNRCLRKEGGRNSLQKWIKQQITEFFIAGADS